MTAARAAGARRALLALAVLASGLAAAPSPAAAQLQTVASEAGPISVERFAGGLVHPWGVAVLPDGRLLVSERRGRLRLIGPGGEVSPPLDGVPEVFDRGQGGLLDVELAPDFASSRRVYLSFAEPGEGGASTALGHGTLGEGRLEGFEVIFRQQPKVPGPNHFGGRVVFAPDGRIFLTLGERFKFEPAQELSNHLGTVVRLEPDGSVPPGNPFVGREGAEPEIWSYGHRNVEAAAIHPETGALWIAEMGPLGGDELNRPEAGRNYGWPTVSWGRHYDGRPIPDPPSHPKFADAVAHWTPVISPSGMIFYGGEAFPAWRGSALVGGLSSGQLVRLRIEGGTLVEEERVPLGARIRDVAEAADGSLYLLTDRQDGAVWRLSPVAD